MTNTTEVLYYAGRAVYKIADVENASMVSPNICDDKQGLAKYCEKSCQKFVTISVTSRSILLS
jgi:hypothetical protein